MSELFNAYNLQKKLKEQSIVVNKEQKDIFLRWKNVLEKKGKNETQLQTDFLNDMFGEVLGYSYKRGLEYSNLEKEQKTETDATKPDGILGFFSETEKVYRVIIELKSIGLNLEASQNKTNDKRSSIEQAFSYVSKYKGIQWVIVSNFKEIRFFSSSYQGDYHSFLITDLEKNEEKQKEFLFLLSKNNLIGVSKEVTPLTKSFLEQDKKAQEVIKHDFYKRYKSKREIFITDVLRNNDINIDTALAKVQKLFDRLLFISFCEDNNLINDAKKLIKDAKNWHDTLWNGLKQVFNFVDKGKLPLVDKFNGGLFANDEIFNNIKINETLLNELIDFLNRYNFKNQITVNILGHIFEQSISDIETLKANLNNTENNKKQSIRKKDGIFYTPEYITKYIVKEAVGGWLNEKKQALGIYDIEEVEIVSSVDKYTYKKGENPNELLISKYKEYKNILENIKVLDPSCGSGAFLVEVFNFLAKEWIDYTQKLFNLGDKHEIGFLSGENLYKDILQKNIYGVDLNSESVQISKLSLWIKTAKKGTELTALDNNIKVGNSLIDDETIETNNYIDNYGSKISLAFKWKEEFKEVFASGGFDVVVGNPPYVRQELFSSIKGYLKEKYSVYTGVADLYCYFYEQATNILKNNGKLGFITSNKWMRANYGEPIRNFILENTKIESFIDLTGQNVFEGVGVDANIIVYEKTKAKDYNFKVSSNLQNFADFKSKNLNVKSFNIEANELERQIKSKMEQVGIPLKDWDIKINYGIKTGFNDAFIIDTKTKEELCKKDAKSAEIIKPMLRGRDISRYSYEWNGLWLIFTRRGIDIEKYQEIKKYLMQFYDDIKVKEKKEKNEKQEKGRKAGSYKWFEIQDNIAYYKDFEKEKIVYPCIMAKEPLFSLDKNNNYLTAPANIITGENMEYILSILNSKLIYFSFRKFYMGGGIEGELKTNNLEQLPIPQISESEQQPFIKKAQDMLDLNKELSKLSNKFLELLKLDLGIAKITKKLESWYKLQDNEFFAEVGKQNKNLSLKNKSEWQNHFEEEKTKALELQNKISTTDNEIDTMVYALYGLNDEEIKTIEDFDI